MQDHTTISAIVLAAGMSRRMGRLKALLPFGDRPMLARTLEYLEAAGNIAPIFVVLGHAAQEIAPVTVQYNVKTIFNPDYEAGGMLSSIQMGVQALPPECAAFFLTLGDQPGVHPNTLRSLRTAWQQTQAPIALPTYNGKRGHPILLSGILASEILSLPAEATLKTLVTRYAEQTHSVAVPDPAILFDIDTPEDYDRALREFKTRPNPSAQEKRTAI